MGVGAGDTEGTYVRTRAVDVSTPCGGAEERVDDCGPQNMGRRAGCVPPTRSPVAPRFVHQDGEKWCMEPRIGGVSGSVWSGEGAAIAWERGEGKARFWEQLLGASSTF